MINGRIQCIYRLTNTINGKIYVGKTVNLAARSYSHAHPRKGGPLQNAIIKYG